MTYPIHRLVRAGDVGALSAALASANKYDLNAVDDDGYTPLYLAAMKESGTSMLSHLLAAGASPDVKGSDKETPLYIAAFNGNAAAVRVLLQGGANVNEVNGPNKDTALHAAARLGFTDVMSLLIESGANVNFRNSLLETPLFQASRTGKIESVYLLLHANANRTLANADLKDPLYIASERGHSGVVQLLKAEVKHLAHTRANVLLEEKSKPPPLSTTESIRMSERRPSAAGSESKPIPSGVEPNIVIPSARTDVAPPSKSRSKSAPRVIVPQRTEPAVTFESAPVLSIEIPQPQQRTHDPFTGKKLAVCKSLVDAGRYDPSPIPVGAVKDFPEMKATYGGTAMVVGSGTEEEIRPRLIFEPQNGDVFATSFKSSTKQQ